MSKKLDLPLGHLKNCQICESTKLEHIIDLGHQAPCDSLLTKEQLNQSENTYPLRFVRCADCGLAQIDYAVAPDVLFYPEYPYRSGITETLLRNLQSVATKMIEKFSLPSNPMVVDIGSNDGTLLQGFKNKGMRVLGVEPTNIAKIAAANGIPTVQAFFGEEIAKKIVQEHGNAAVVTAANMFAHIPNLGDLIRGVSNLLVEGGVFLTESHYLLDLLETNQYDSIYHEHLKYYSLAPMIKMFSYYDFTVVDAERIPNYGGSIRVYAVKGKNHTVSERLKELLIAEENAGLNSRKAFDDFAVGVRKQKNEFMELLHRLKREGKTVVGVGCPGRSSTLLNYCNIDTDLMPYIAEQNTSLKLGLHLPGRHIPIVDEKRLFEENPDYAVMLSWHYCEPIVKKLRAKGLKSKIIAPLPQVKILDY